HQAGATTGRNDLKVGHGPLLALRSVQVYLAILMVHISVTYMLDLFRLRLLSELAHRGTMTAVGTALRMTSSAVSQQLATLEREAGVPWLERVGRGVRFTPEGARLAAHALEIIAAVEAAAADLRSPGKRPEGILEVACFSTYARTHLVP